MAIHRLLARTGACALVAACAATANADFTFSSFASTNIGSGASQITLVGNAARTTTGTTANRLRITAASASQVGAAWYNTKQSVAQGFTCTFQFSINHDGGDGFAFLIQNAGTGNTTISPSDGEGCELGYQGIPNSVVLEFDTYQGDVCGNIPVGDPNANHISLHTRGTQANSVSESASLGYNTLTNPSINLSSNTTHTCTITYAAGIMSVAIDGNANLIQTPIDLASTLSLDGGKAYVGFTGATGGSSETHDILSWSFTANTTGAVGDAQRPLTPSILSPGIAATINPQDLHMVLQPMVSPVGANNACTDWEIWKTSTNSLVWSAECAPDLLRTGIELFEGTFVNAYVGRTSLEFSTDYIMRVRFKDDSGNPNSQYSYWAVLPFVTYDATTAQPLTLKHVRKTPVPSWKVDATSADVALPVGVTVAIDDPQGDLLLRATGQGASTLYGNTLALATAVPVRLHITTGATALNVGPSKLVVNDETCLAHTIYVPALSVAANTQAVYWIDANGSTYIGSTTETAPDLLVLARGSDIPWLIEQPGYVVEVAVNSGLRLPCNIAFVPNPGPNPTDPMYYVTQLYGDIAMVSRSGVVSSYATGLLNYNPTGQFPGSGEGGVTGIAVDPVSGDLFVSMLYLFNPDPANPGSPGTSSSPRTAPQIVRFHSTDGGHTAATQTVLKQFPTETMLQSHLISNTTIGPDGKLYVHMGDGLNDATRGQSLNFYGGKILRMNLDGTPCTDNPMYNAADGIGPKDYLWVYGLRNPFGGAWRLSDGTHFTIENAPNNYDRISMAKPGLNYLYDGSDNSMLNYALYSFSPPHGPVNIAFAQTAVFSGSGFPAEKMDHAFATESGPTYGTGPQSLGKRVSEFVFGPKPASYNNAAPDFSAVRQSGPIPLVEYIGAGQASAVGLAFGPDGLYFSELYKDVGASGPSDPGARIMRIRYVGASAASCPPECLADIVSIGQQPPPDGLITGDDYVAFINAFFSGNMLADIVSVGQQLPPDGLLTGDDYVAFINSFFSGC